MLTNLLRSHTQFVVCSALFLTLGAASLSAAAPPFIQGTGNASFVRFAMLATPAAGAAQPMTAILSLNGLGDVLMYCYSDATPRRA